MNHGDFPEDSDTSDDDYVPEGKPEEVVSEVDSDGDPEEPLSDAEDTGKRGKKRTKKATKSRKKAKSDDSKPSTEVEQVKEEDKKKQEENIWADFMKDTGFLSKSNAKTEPPHKTNNDKPKEPTRSNREDAPAAAKPKQEKVKITQIFEFAGEEVTVEKEVAANSAEARLLLNKPASDKPAATRGGKSGGGLSGIGSVLNQLGRKPKISTLEKSKLDWDKFKKEENIDEELQTHNKGKDGYLERQDFLQRADLRRFEIEKEARNVERNKRMNN